MGASAVTAPILLNSLRQKDAVAQAAPRPKRLLILFTPHGAPAEYFWPQSATSYTSSLPNDVSILSSLQKHASKINVIRGMNYVGSNNHPAIHDALTNHGADSIETVVARKLGVKPLRLGVVPDYTQSFTTDGMLTFDGGRGQQGNPDPAAVFDALVSGLPTSSGGGGTPPPPSGPTPADLRKRALLVPAAELAALGQRLTGSPLAARISKHQSALAGLTAPSMAGPSMPVVGCTTRPSLPSVEKVRGKNIWAADQFADVMQAQMDIALFALRCGLTRVATIQCGYVNYGIPFSWLGFTEGHHELSHSSPGALGRIKHAKCQAWFAQQFSTMLDALDVPDPEDPAHTMLDNTTALWCSELADGQEHNCESIPLVLAGGGSGYFKTGQYLQLGARSHAQLLNSMCAAMGATGVDFGNGVAAGTLAEVQA